MASDIEVSIVFPAGEADIKRRRYNTLQVAGNQRQLRFDKLDAFIEMDLAFKHADAGHIKGHAIAFEMEEDSVAPGKAVTMLSSSASQLSCSLNFGCLPIASQFPKENRDASFTSFSTL